MSSVLVFVRPAKGAWRDAEHVQIDPVGSVFTERCVTIDGYVHHVWKSANHGLFAMLPQYAGLARPNDPIPYG